MSSGRAFVVDAESDLQALSRILDRIAVMRMRCTNVNATFAGGRQRITIELRDAAPARVHILLDRIASMPCVHSAQLLADTPVIAP